MRVTIIAGEASGDLYGAELTRAMHALDPTVQVSGMGGPRMRRAGVSLLRDTSAWGAIGVVNALKVVPRALLAYAALRRFLRAQRPSVVAPIDFGTFNVTACRYARSLGIPVYYFIAPGSWRKRGPVRPSLLEAADVFCTQFPWHAERLRAAGANAEFYGHPLLDVARPSAPAAALRSQWGLPTAAPVLCLLPGSRRHEVEHLLPVFLDAGARICRQIPGTRFLLGLAEVVDRAQVGRILQAHGWRPRALPGDPDWGSAGRALSPDAPEALIATGRTYDCLAVSRAALCASGTVTLEAALLGVPQVIAYRGSAGMRLQYQFVKHKIKYVGLPNLLLDEAVCPELLDVAATPERIAAASLPLLAGDTAAREQNAALRRLREMLGQPGTIAHAAARIVEIGSNHHG